MEDIFSKFYGNYIKNIHDFLNFGSDILYISGYSGSGKSSVLKKALETYDKKILNFHHLCFKNTVTDDFLLSFYDTFRTYALKQTITLTKNPETEFVQKVNFYFRNLEYPAVVVIDNFEDIPDESDIVDFLIHISGYENVKIIVISKKPACRLLENPTVSVEQLNFEKVGESEFVRIIKDEFKDADDVTIRKLYSATEGFELYLKMVLGYLESISIPLNEFMAEFEAKEISFEEFIIEKQVSLIPSIYYPILKNLAFIYHDVRPKFIEQYDLGDTKQIPYLHAKFIVSEFFGTYHIKSYLRKYFEENTSIQEKTQIFRKLISIYGNELEKSPKDRILRLSRETIRSQIALLEKKLPQIQKTGASPVFNYIPTPIQNTAQWFITANIPPTKPSPKFKQSGNIKNKPKKERIKPKSPVEAAIENAKILEDEYKFKEAALLLEPVKKSARNLDEKIKILSRIARNLLKINDNNGALSNLAELCAECKKADDEINFAKYRIETGKIYKKMYSLSRAAACFKEIGKMSEILPKELLAEAKISLAEIYELENNSNGAIEEYKGAMELLPENSYILPEIAYKAGVLLDEAGLFEDALEAYFNSIRFFEISNNDKYLIKSYAACGLIYSEYGQTQDALSYLEYALELSKNSESYIDTYFIARSIAGIYRNTEPEKSYDYLVTALDYAKLSDNSFEIAISLLELGDYYYDLKQNEQALICYFQAKTTLGASASKENLERVTTRINDMKIKLGNFVFNAMKALYDPE